MNGCTIGSDAMLAAGALLTEHKDIPARELWAGAPARRVREIDDAQAAGMQMGVAHYVLNGPMPRATAMSLRPPAPPARSSASQAIGSGGAGRTGVAPPRP